MQAITINKVPKRIKNSIHIQLKKLISRYGLAQMGRKKSYLTVTERSF